MTRPSRRLSRRLTLTLALAGAHLLTTGCASTDLATLGQVQPWEKGHLARPEMGFDSDPLRRAFLEHTYSSKESSSGGTGVAGGGCGCN